METKVSNNIVEPRSYQLYGDDIESKQAVEPISIVAGNGPICGFNYLDISDSSKIILSGFNNPNLDLSGFEDEVANNPLLDYQRVGNPISIISDKSNTHGVVVNAYNTPDGLIHIAPDTLTINNGPSNGWPDISSNNPNKAVIFALKARHTYTDQATDEVPNQDDFEVVWLDNSKVSILQLIHGSYENVIKNILPSGWINLDTDTLIGLYVVGWDKAWDTELGDKASIYKNALLSICKYKLSLVAYGGKWPTNIVTHCINYLLSEVSLQYVKDNIAKYIKPLSITENMLSKDSVTKDKVAEKAIIPWSLSDDLEDIRGSVLNVYGVNITGTGSGNMGITVSSNPLVGKSPISPTVESYSYNTELKTLSIDIRLGSTISYSTPYVYSAQCSISSYSGEVADTLPYLTKVEPYFEDSGVTINGYDKVYYNGIRLKLLNVSAEPVSIGLTMWLITGRTYQ